MSPNKVIIVNLSDSRSGSYNTVSILSLAMNTLVLGAVWLTSDGSRTGKIAFFGTSLGLVAIIFLMLRILKIFKNSFNPAISLFILSVAWALLDNYLIAVFNILLAFLAWQANKPAALHISEGGLIMPDLFKKTTPWNEVSAVMLRDSVLTVDFKSNQLIQVVIDSGLNPTLDEASFNAFCREQIAKTGEKASGG